MIYWTSDTHFGHANIIKYVNRPFPNAEEMDTTMKLRWNARVRPDDTIYFLGDLSFFKAPQTIEIVEQLNGKKYWVFGNHDKHLRDCKELLALFEDASDYMYIKVDDQDAPGGLQIIVLMHYAMRVWNQSHYGSWHLYGHSHGTLPDLPESRSLDVGVDMWNFAPVSYDQVKERMSLKTFKPIDYHGTLNKPDKVQKDWHASN